MLGLAMETTCFKNLTDPFFGVRLCSASKGATAGAGYSGTHHRSKQNDCTDWYQEERGAFYEIELPTVLVTRPLAGISILWESWGEAN
jgi:hypothetical protein